MVTIASLELPLELLYVMMAALFVFSCVGLAIGPKYIRVPLFFLVIGLIWSALIAYVRPDLAAKPTLANVLIFMSVIGVLIGVIFHQQSPLPQQKPEQGRQP